MGHWLRIIECYEQGKAAYHASDTRSNPYPKGSQPAMAWDAGWDKAWDKAVEAGDLVEARLTIAQRLASWGKFFHKR